MKNYAIDWVMSEDYPSIKKTKTDEGYKTICPKCAGNKLYVNTNKNLAYCQKCNSHFNSLTLHATATGVSNKEAYKDLKKRFEGLPSELKTKISNPVVEEEPVKALPILIRNSIYRKLLERLELKPKHRDMLRARGLTDNDIDTLGYKSVPEKAIDMTDALNELYSRSEVMNVLPPSKYDIELAGFEWRGNSFVATARKSGVLIPILVKDCHYRYFDEDLRREEEYISAFQIRFDEGDRRYAYYSQQGQFNGYESIHMRLPDSYEKDGCIYYPDVDRVIITEGCLKSDVASALSNNSPFIAVMGVNNQKWLLKTLKVLKERYKTNEIVFAFDMDRLDNLYVQKALDRAMKTCKHLGFKVRECEWEQEYKQNGIKGIDDLLLYRKKKRG